MKNLDRFVIVCAGLLVERGKVLMIRETKREVAGMYNLPAGTLEPGENVLQAVVREVHEETGLRVRPVRLIGVYDRVKAKQGNHVLLLVFSVRRTGGRIRTSKEHPEVLFMSPQRIRTLKRAGKIRFNAIYLVLRDYDRKRPSPIPVRQV